MKQLWLVSVLVVMASACGGGDSGADTATSDDRTPSFALGEVVVTLEIPVGAVPTSTKIEISDGAVPAELAEDNDLTVYAFNLEPSGVEFSQPATIVFRVPAPGDAGTPLASVLLEDADGTTTVLSANATRHGNEVEVSALIDHFSRAFLVLDNETELQLTPQLLPMRVPETGRSQVIVRFGDRSLSEWVDDVLGTTTASEFQKLDPEGWSDEFDATVLPAGLGYITVEAGNGWVDVTCIAETDGVVENAYEVSWVWYKYGPPSYSSDGEIVDIAFLAGNVSCDVEEETALVPPGLDPRAHIVGVEPILSANGTLGIIVIPAQQWTGLPDLDSFFVELDITTGECSMTTAVETHLGTVNAPGPWWLLNDGSSFIDTGCNINHGAPIDINVRSGSWVDESTTQPVFADFVFRIDPDAVANAPGPFDMSRVVDNLGAAPVPPELEGFRITGASNDGNGKITVEFKGPVKDLVEGDEHIVEIWIDASEGDISVSVSLRNLGGELIPNGSTTNQEDAVDGTIDGKRVDTVWEWTAGNQVVVTMVSTEGVAIPSTEPTVTVHVTKTGSTDKLTFSR